jgi:hypothetical protein
MIRKYEMKTKVQMNRPPSEYELAKCLKERYQGTVYAFDSFRRWVNGSLVYMSTDQIKKEILDVLIAAKNEGIQPSVALINSVFEIVKLMCLFIPPINENHSIREFLKARCEKGTVHLVLQKDIWPDYCEWAPANGYTCRPEEELMRDLILRGFVTKSFEGHIYWAGLRLKLGQVPMKK